MASRWLSATVDADPRAGTHAAQGARAVFTGEPAGDPARHRARLLAAQHQAGVDPTRPAPRIISEQEAAARLASHPLGRVAPIVRAMLSGVAQDARHIVVISDADGMLLSAEGHPQMLDAAAANNFLPGALLSEAAAGTNAVGTTLYLDHPLQIFSAEHFNGLFHGWTCSAAPIHDPAPVPCSAAIDLSGNFRTAHPHSMSLVTAVARLAETQLALEAARRDAYLRERYLALVMRGARRRARSSPRPDASLSPARRRGCPTG